MTSHDRIDIHKDLSTTLKSNLDIHLKKIIALFQRFVCQEEIEEIDLLLKKHTYDDCEITHLLETILNSKIKNIDEKKEKILNLNAKHKRLHDLVEVLLIEYKKNGVVDQKTYKDFAIVEFDFLQNLTALAIESENYEKNFDGLTNIYNRKYFFEKISYDFSKARRTRTDFSIVMGDIDYFKKINDDFGHQAGDYILVEISKLFVEHIRAYDIVARYGGEEFIFFIYSDAKETVHIFSRIKQILKDKKFSFNGQDLNVKCSFGIAQDRSELSIGELVTLADQALYEAKAEGRNKIIVH